MSNKFYLVLYLFVLAFLCSCSDEFHSANIKLIDTDKDHKYFINEKLGKVIIPEQVVNVRDHGDYLLVLRMLSESVDCFDAQGVPTIITHYSEKEEYWLIDKKVESVEGPFNKREFELLIQKIGLNVLNLNVPDSYRSNTEYFSKMKSKCVRVD